MRTETQEKNNTEGFSLSGEGAKIVFLLEIVQLCTVSHTTGPVTSSKIRCGAGNRVARFVAATRQIDTKTV